MEDLWWPAGSSTLRSPLGGKVEWQQTPQFNNRWRVAAAISTSLWFEVWVNVLLLQSNDPLEKVWKRKGDLSQYQSFQYTQNLPSKAFFRKKISFFSCVEYQETTMPWYPMWIMALNSFGLFVPVNAYLITESQKKNMNNRMTQIFHLVRVKSESVILKRHCLDPLNPAVIIEYKLSGAQEEIIHNRKSVSQTGSATYCRTFLPRSSWHKTLHTSVCVCVCVCVKESDYESITAPTRESLLDIIWSEQEIFIGTSCC